MLRIFIATTLALLLTACATIAPQEKHLYDGPKQPANQLLAVKVPAEIEVLSLNQRPLENTTAAQFLGGAEQTLLLAPGEHVITGYYKELWLNHEESHHVVRSQPADFTVAGIAGDVVSLNYTAPKNLAEATALAENFNGWAVNQRTQASTPSAPSQQQRPKLLASNNPSTPVAPLATNSTTHPPSNLLPMLKAYWNEANAEERRAFLEWIGR